MSKTFAMVAAAALFASVTAFAQTPAPAPSSDASAPAAAPSDDSGKPEKPMHKHGGHHHMAGKAGTDENADKLNACMSNATPTSQQESCLKSASGTGNG
jgi:Spy/CpxP family protein refolding chaperone